MCIERIYIYIFFFGRVFFKSSAYQWTCHIMPSQLAVVCFQLAFVLGISVGVVTSEGNEPLMTWFSGVDHGATIEAQLHSHRCGHQRSAASCFNPHGMMRLSMSEANHSPVPVIQMTQHIPLPFLPFLERWWCGDWQAGWEERGENR